MKINIPKVLVPVDLGEYAQELAGKQLLVWVNPPKLKLQEYADLLTALQSQELSAAKATLFPEKQAEDVEKNILLKTFHLLEHWLRVRKEQPASDVDPKLLAWYAEIWSQGPTDSHWTVAELRELEIQDPSFLSWMIAQTWKARAEHIERKKKA